MWTESFFRGPFFDVQRAMWEAADEAAFLEKALDLAHGARVLDVACGVGRHALVLAGHGYAVTGVDAHDAAVDEARRAAEARGLAARFEVADMRALAFDEAFDAAFCFWGSFGYFDDDGDRAVLEGVRRALRPGGRLLVDVHVAESLFPVFEPRSWHWWGEGDGRTRVLEERRYDPWTGRVETDWTFQRGGDERAGHSSVRVYTARELAERFHDAGFHDLEAMETLTGEPFDVGASRLSLVGTR